MGKTRSVMWRYTNFLRSISVGLGLLGLFTLKAQTSAGLSTSSNYDVKTYGAVGDGATLDSPAINRAIEAASSKGGGTVWIPAGTYRSVSIRLRSNVVLFLDAGAVLMAANRDSGVGYDTAEPNPSNKYQDFGHTHFHNSLIWGENLENVSILGRGRIWGKGLVRDFTKDVEDGNKAISLRDCRNVTLRDFTIQHGGWFGILATGVDHLTIDNLILDTNRDGMDIDCCRDVHVANCSVNSPTDDGICLKSSLALGYARPTENVTISNCLVSGFKEGSFLDGTFKREGHPVGRIKFGTESNGGFRNIAISNCLFDFSSGLALETVDGGLLEDVTISNLAMRDIVNAPIFLRLGRRMRGPDGVPVGALRRVSISDVRVVGAREPSIISGVPGYPIEDITLKNFRIYSRGSTDPKLPNAEPIEDEKGYPEPGSLGKMPAQGFYIRHAKNIEFSDVELRTDVDDPRSPVQLVDVDGADFFQIKVPFAHHAAPFKLENVRNFRARSVDVLSQQKS